MLPISSLPFPTLIVDRMLHIKGMSQSALRLFGSVTQFSDVLDAGSMLKRQRLLDETLTDPIEMNLKTNKDEQELFAVSVTWSGEEGIIQCFGLGNKIEKIMTVVQEHQNRLAHVDFELLSQKEVAEKQLVQIKRLSAPIIPLSKHVALVPLFGHLDQDLIVNTQERLSAELYERNFTIVVFDFNGIEVITDFGMNQFQELIETFQIMGIQPYIVGIKPKHTGLLKHYERGLTTYLTTLQEAISLLT